MTIGGEGGSDADDPGFSTPSATGALLCGPPAIWLDREPPAPLISTKPATATATTPTATMIINSRRILEPSVFGGT